MAACRCAIATFLCLALVSGSVIRAQQGDQNPPPSLAYYVPKDVVFAEVVETTTVTRRIDIDAVQPKPPAAVTPDAGLQAAIDVTTRVSREGSVSLKTIADVGLGPAYIDNSAKALSDNAITVELRDGTLLKSLSLASTGRLGDVIVSIAKFVATVLPSAALAKQGDAGAHVDLLTECNPHESPYRDQPDGVRLFLARNADACAQWNEMRKVSGSIKKNRAARIEIEWEIKGASAADLKVLVEKLRLAQEAIDKEETELGALQERFNARLEEFLAGLKIGTTSSARTITKVIELDTLQTVKDLESANLRDGTDEGTAASTIDNTFPNTATQALWRDARIIVAVDKPDLKRPSGLPAQDKSDDVAVLFRQSIPVRMQVLVSTQANDKTPRALKLATDRIEQVVHPSLPVQRLTFKRSILAERQLALSFDDKSRPVRMERSGKSNVAALASSIATAATTFRDEYAASLDKVVAVQESQRKIQLNDLTARLERAKKEKEVLDAQLQLDASTSNFASSLKQQQAAQNLAQLQAEAALAAAQQTNDQQLQIAQLKVAIEQLRQQIDQLKAEQELKKLTSGGGQ